jgi:winged helix DNA-binding protein
MSLRVRRAAAQLLHRPGRAKADAVVRRLLAVQAQDLRSARLALRARTEGLRAADVETALTDERSLAVGWLGRGTLHLVAAEDYPWLLALTAPPRVASNARRLGQEGVSPDDAERAVAVIEAALADEGPLTRAELAQRIAARGTRTEGQATPHLLMLAALRGVAVLGPVRGDKQAFVLARDWLGEASGAKRGAARAKRSGAGQSAPPTAPSGAERDVALAELARRYLAAHGPATDADLATWAGLPLRDARAGLRAIASELADAGRDGLVDLAAREAAPDHIPPRLLPAFDPYLLGWKHRGFAVPERHAKRVHPGGGTLRAAATVDGLVVGTWTLPRGQPKLDLLSRVTRAAAVALQEEADEIAAFVATSARPS